MLVEEIVDRRLLFKAFDESRKYEQQVVIDEWADNFGYTKIEE